MEKHEQLANTAAALVAQIGGFSATGPKVEFGNGNWLYFCTWSNGDAIVEFYRGEHVLAESICCVQELQELLEIAAESIANYTLPVPKPDEPVPNPGPTRIVVVQKMWLTESAVEVPVDWTVDQMLAAAEVEANEMEFCTWEGTVLTDEDTDEELYTSG